MIVVRGSILAHVDKYSDSVWPLWSLWWYICATGFLVYFLLPQLLLPQCKSCTRPLLAPSFSLLYRERWSWWSYMFLCLQWLSLPEVTIFSKAGQAITASSPQNICCVTAFDWVGVSGYDRSSLPCASGFDQNLVTLQVELALATPQNMHCMFSFSISVLRYTLAAFEDCKNNQ